MAGMRISVIIVTRYRPQLLRACLVHLEQQTLAPQETIVVDSSDNDDSQAVLDDFPWVKRLRIQQAGRTSTCQARNLGIRHAKGDLIVFLDDDCMAPRDWLSRLMAACTAPDIGIVGGRWIDQYEASRVRLQDPRVGILQVDGYITTNFVLDPGEIVEVDHLRGGNIAFRREALDQVGLFDPHYDRCLGLLEDTDLCVRIKQNGWRLLYQPEAVVEHLGGARRDYKRGVPFDPRYVIRTSRGYAYLFFKNFGYNYYTFKNILGGRQILYIKFFLESPRWPTFRAIWLYGLGAWWGLADSLGVCLRWMLRRE